MPWFSRKKKRKQKKAVGNATRDDAVVTTTSQPAFAVVVQSFESSVSDQISVERGQVVEALFTEDDWIYARNVNGRCGYVPGNFCFPLEKLRMGLPEESSERVRQLRAHPRPTTIHVDTFGDTGGEVGVVRGGGGGKEGEEEEEVNSPDSGISCSHQASSSNMESVHSSLHNTRERLAVGSSRQAAVDVGVESDRSHTHPVRHPERHKRFVMPNSSLPLLETAAPPTSSELGRPLPHSPSPPPLQPVTLSQTPRHANHAAMATIADGDDPQSASDGDDVFLPEANKPLGIYQCAETYTPQFEGEIPLHRDEVVVVLEAGSGEWVWAMGSEGKEGLVLKSLLHKYRPDVPEDEEDEIDIGEDMGGAVEEHGAEEEPPVGEREGMRSTGSPAGAESEILTSSSATQTELIIDGVVRELTSSVPPRPPASAAAASSPAQETASISIQTEFTLPNWFKNNTPVATPNHTLTRSTTRGDSQAAAANTSSSSHPPQCHGSHSQNTSPPQPIPHESSAPPKLLCSPRSSHSSSNSAGATATSPVENHSRHPNTPATTPSGCRVPLTPASTPPRPSVLLQTPSGNHTARTLISSNNTSATPPVIPRGDGTPVTSPSQPPPTRSTNTTDSAQQPTRGGRSVQARQATPAAPNNGMGTIQRHRQALVQHTRIINSIRFEPDNEAGAASRHSSSARRRMQPTPIVTAVRDYSPPQRARNALVLRRGDIMYAQPHVPFPHGWVWVYHTLHKKFGYVPKDHIAYMYLVQKDQGTVLEDVV